MTQDTRKDRRVKIVSLNVRYKSATVDEFIENHAHDVSRGGIFIKTTNPFPGGTLLKFEIRLLSEQAVIAGVGRVVWKRDSSTASVDHPAGMGVKFIKVDEPSKAVIDRLIATRADAGKSFEEEGYDPTLAARGGSNPPAAASTVPVHTPTLLGVSASSSSAPSPGFPDLPATGSKGSAPPSDGRAGALASARSSPPRPDKHAMFPKAEFEKETYPKQEQTVMKQAAELLEEALREAGGSMDEVGTNPLFSGTGSASRIAAQAAVAASDNDSNAPATKSAESASRRAEDVRPDTKDATIRAKTMLGGMSPAATKPSSERPRAPSESPKRKDSATASGRPGLAATRGSKSPQAMTATRRPVPTMAILLGAGVAIALCLVLFRDSLFGDGTEKANLDTLQTTPSAITTVAPPAPSATATTATAEPTASAVAAAPAVQESASAAPAEAPASASSALATSGTQHAALNPTPPPKAPVMPAPVHASPRPVPTSTAGAAPTAAAAPSVELPAGGTPTSASASSPRPAANAAPSSPHPMAPPPLPPAKPAAAKPVDDNPY